LEDPLWKSGSIQVYEYSQHSYDSPGEVHALEITGWTETARKQFHPLGIGRKAGSRQLSVVNHAPDGPFIEQLELSADGKSAKHVRSIKHDLLHAPNSVAPLSDTELLVTNDHMFTPHNNKVLNKLETFLAPPIASVVHLDLNTNKAVILARLPFANGIIPLNGTHLAVSSTSTPAIFIYAMDVESKALTLTKKIRAPFFTDNLKLDATGKLLVAGHPHPRPVDVMALNQRKYNLDNDPMATELLPEKDRPRSGSWVSEWDGNEEGKLRDLYIGSDFDTACAASRDVHRGVGIITGLYAKGILLWKE
jgi:arylesterase/paraoxonase